MGKELLGAYRESIVEMSAEVCLASSSFFFLSLSLLMLQVFVGAMCNT